MRFLPRWIARPATARAGKHACFEEARPRPLRGIARAARPEVAENRRSRTAPCVCDWLLLQHIAASVPVAGAAPVWCSVRWGDVKGHPQAGTSVHRKTVPRTRSRDSGAVPAVHAGHRTRQDIDVLFMAAAGGEVWCVCRRHMWQRVFGTRQISS